MAGAHAVGTGEGGGIAWRGGGKGILILAHINATAEPCEPRFGDLFTSVARLAPRRLEAWMEQRNGGPCSPWPPSMN